jgi:hypothetical protein
MLLLTSSLLLLVLSDGCRTGGNGADRNSGAGGESRFGEYMAVLELDGNAFGEWRRRLPGPLHGALASVLLEVVLRRTLVEALKPELAAMGDALRNAALAPREKFRQAVQLLAFAGDEATLCVPGHRGFRVALDVLRGFGAKAAEWAARPLFGGLDLSGLTLRAGLVIANHKTPIQHLKQAAHHLLEGPARRESQAGDHRQAALDWAVLKSHDVPPQGIVAAREAALGGATTRPHALRQFRRLHDLAHGLLREGFPRRQLKRRALAAARHREPPELSADARDVLGRVNDGDWLRNDAPPGVWVDLDEMLEVVAVEGSS